MDKDTERFFQGVITALTIATALGLAVVSALAWWVA